MGSIQRGVSLYSFQDAYARKQMTLDEIFAALAEMGVRGIEVLSDQMIHGAPHPDDATVAAWRNRMARFGFESVANDIFINATLYRNRRLTLGEQLALLKAEILNAHRLGFPLVRLVSDTNPLLIEPALETAQKAGVAMALEVHGGKSFHTVNTENYIAVMKKLNTPLVGLILDTGIFCRRHPRVATEYALWQGLSPAVADYIDAIYDRGIDPNQIYGPRDPHDRSQTFPFPAELKALLKSPVDLQYATFAATYENTPFEKLDAYLPFVKSIHGKFYDMTPDCAEASVRFADLIDYLKAADWSGYICSEYEGNRFVLPGCAVNELEQVRRHQQLLKTCIGA